MSIVVVDEDAEVEIGEGEGFGAGAGGKRTEAKEENGMRLPVVVEMQWWTRRGRGKRWRKTAKTKADGAGITNAGAGRSTRVKKTSGRATPQGMKRMKAAGVGCS
jgi:hypothetical protein